jgi:hypothetical protein
LRLIHPYLQDTETTERLSSTDVCTGMWVFVNYDGSKYLGKVINILKSEEKGSPEYQVRCLKVPYTGKNIPSELELEEQAVYYTSVYKTVLSPKLEKFGRKFLWAY